MRVAQPGALVAALGGNADEVARRPLHAVGGGEDAGEVGVDGIFRRQVEAEPGMAHVETEGGLEAETFSAPAAIFTPQRGEAPAIAMSSDGEGLQRLAAVGTAAPDRAADAGLLLELDGFAEESHSQASAGPPSILAASWNQRVR